MRALVSFVVLWLAYRAVLVWRYPHTRCRGCKGTGRVYQDDEKRFWRDHRKCGGSGKRQRFGRRAWNYTRKGK